METNTEGKAERFFKEFGKKLDQFLIELKEAGTRAEADMQEKYEDLKEAAEKIKKEAGNKDRWNEVESALKKAGAELENAFKSAFKKKENS